MRRHKASATTDARDLVPTRHTGAMLTPHPFIDYQDRYRGAMLGTAIGDALGRPVEGRSPRGIQERFGELTDFRPWRGWTNGPTGTFTDDTEMALCIAQSIVEQQGIDPTDLADRFRAWGRIGRGMGSATRAACRRMADGFEWYEAGSDSAGNGAAMRAAPIGLFDSVDMDALRTDAAATAVITHNQATAAASTIVTSYTVAHLLHTPVGQFDAEDLLIGIEAIMADVGDPALPERRDHRSVVTLLQRIRDVFAMRDRSLEEIFALTHNGAFVLESLPAAFAAFLASPEDPEQVIIAAVNGGYDADTIGAMAGAFAGAYHGGSGLPGRWVNDIEFRTGLEGVADELLSLTGLGPLPAPIQNPAPDEYDPFVVDGRRWITLVHSDSAALQPDEAHDIRLMPHPTAARELVR
ncbi:MAG: ADP-ribosylglycohydrolase family protein [Actinomycetota bacterium]|nr:ADP-ribosylglycohydrolase family protein [Actinomycetota bacterium]